MRIAVCVKQVETVPGQIQLLDDSSGVDGYFVERELNDPDRYAVEESLRIRDALGGGEVIAVTLGAEAADQAVRDALAMGVDRGVRVAGSVGRFDPVAVARGLAVAISAAQVDLVITGIQSTDEGQQATGPALAAVLGWPCVAGVTAVVVVDGKAEVHRELEGGRIEVVETEIPAVLVVQTGLNQPRYGSFRDKMNAKKAEIEIIALEDDGQKQSPTLRRVFFDGARSEGMELIEGGPDVVAARIMDLVRGAT